MLMNEFHGWSVVTAKTPASVPSYQPPPRSNAAGRLLWLEPGPPKQLKSLPKPADQCVQPSDRSAQSSTHSQTLPTMSKTPQLDTQPGNVPVGPGAPALTIQGAPSGVPAAARCHSPFLMSRLPETAHASFAWNHVAQLGFTPEMETA